MKPVWRPRGLQLPLAPVSLSGTSPLTGRCGAPTRLPQLKSSACITWSATSATSRNHWATESSGYMTAKRMLSKSSAVYAAAQTYSLPHETVDKLDIYPYSRHFRDRVGLQP